MAFTSHFWGGMNAGFVGIGGMGNMLVRVLLRSGVLTAQEVSTTNRSQAKIDALASEFPGVRIANAKQLSAKYDLIFLRVNAPDAGVAG